MQKSEHINELAAALAKAQAAITGAKKGTENPFFKSKYADLAEVWDVIRKPLSDNGLSVAQFPSIADGRVNVTTLLAHSSGQFVSDTLSLRMVKERKNQDTGEKEFIPLDDPQAAGSAITYARRYALAAAVGVAQEDDDGNAASEQTHKDASTKRQTTPKPEKTAKQECSELAEKLGIPAPARKAAYDDAGGDWNELKRRLQHALAEKEAREAKEKEGQA